MIVEQRKFEFIDALRGIAILGVIMAHTADDFTLRFMGAYGVQLFFVVSAFTLFLSLETKYHVERHPVINYFIRRFFRIAPAFYLAAIFYLLKDGLEATFWAPSGIHFWQIASTLTFTHGWHPESINLVVPGGWSIAVEYTFYLFVPLCFVYVRDLYKALLLSFVLLALGLTLSNMIHPAVTAAYPAENGALANYFVQLWFPSQACVFPLGFVLYFLFHNKPVSRQSDKFASAGLLAISAYLCVAFTRGSYSFLQPHFLYGLAFVLLGYALALHPYRFLVNSVMCYIGKLSFSIYLFHFWSIKLVKEYVLPFVVLQNSYAMFAVYYACTTALTVAIATVTYRLVEEPGQAMGRALIRRIEAG